MTRGQTLPEGASVEEEALSLAVGDLGPVLLEIMLLLLISASLWPITIVIGVLHQLRQW